MNKPTDQKKKIWIAVAIIAVLVLAWLLWRGSTEPEPVPADRAEQPAPTAVAPEPVLPVERPAERSEAAAPAPAEAIVAPPPSLRESDDAVKAAASELSPQLGEWLTPQEQIRKSVLLVDLAASGRVPVKNRPLNYPAGRFEVERRDNAIYLSEENFERAETLVDTLTAIPPAQLARYYRTWQPLLEEAYQELGRSESFDARVSKAIDQVLATEPLRGDVQLEQPSVFYTYADPELESANDISKFLWRLGPENTEQLQAYVRELKPLLE